MLTVLTRLAVWCGTPTNLALVGAAFMLLGAALLIAAGMMVVHVRNYYSHD